MVGLIVVQVTLGPLKYIRSAALAGIVGSFSLYTLALSSISEPLVGVLVLGLALG